MGYFIENLKDIAEVSEPARFSLSANPNFVQLESKKQESKKIEIQLNVTGNGYIKVVNPKDKTYYMSDAYNIREGYYYNDNGNIIFINHPQKRTFTIDINTVNTATCTFNGRIQGQYNINYLVQLNNGTEHYIPIWTEKDTLSYTFDIPANAKSITVTNETNEDFSLLVSQNGVSQDIWNNISKFTVRESKTLTDHAFEGTSDISKISDKNFYIGAYNFTNNPEWINTPNKVAESLANTLKQNYFLGNNFDITLPPVKNADGSLTMGTTIKLQSRGSGKDYAFEIIADDPRLSATLFTVVGNSENASNEDSFSEGHSPVELHLELYKDTGVFPGTDSTPNDKNMGSFVTTLTKSYANSPLWFNVNILESKDYAPDFLNGESAWFDTGTIRDFRFTVKRLISSKSHYENSIFYYSDVFYAINGYQRTLEANDLSAYVYDASAEFPPKEKQPGEDKEPLTFSLTTQPELFHIKGQTQYFNFLLSDADHDNKQGGNLAVTYRILSQSGRFLTEKVMHVKPKNEFFAVNTIRLDIDGAVKEYPNAGRVEICLSRSLYEENEYIAVTEPLKFRILPSCLYKVNDFAFLNSLGGWSSFNFAGTDQSEFKTKTNTIFKTHTPDKNISSELEAVFSKDVEEQFTVQTMPVTRDVAEWLRELSTSKAVYELSTKRYVIVDELIVKPNSKDDLFRLDMKYRYSDTYNAK